MERAQQLGAARMQANPSATTADIDSMVLFDLRDQLIQELSVATVKNREANVGRMGWLKSALASLMVSLTLAYATMFGLLIAGNSGKSHAAGQPKPVLAQPSAERSSGADVAHGTAAPANVGTAPKGPLVSPGPVH